MSTLPSFSSPIVRDKFLLHASPELVYSYLQANPIHAYENTLADKLLERNDTIIDLALASFSQVLNVIQELLERKNKEIIIAVCENICTSPTYLIDIQTFKSILNDKEGDEFKKEFLHSFFSNKLFTPHHLNGLFDCRYPIDRLLSYENITENELDQCIVPILRHVIYFKDINSSPDHPFIKMGDRFDTTKIKNALGPCIGKSLIRLEPNYANRESLNSAIEVLQASVIPHSYDINDFLDPNWRDDYKPLEGLRGREQDRENEIKFLDKIFEKWGPIDEETSKHLDKVPRTTLLANIACSITSNIRNGLYYSAVMDAYLENHPHLSVRSGYYKGYDFSRVDKATFEEFYERDKLDFVSSVVVNKSAYSSSRPNLRARLDFIIDEFDADATERGYELSINDNPRVIYNKITKEMIQKSQLENREELHHDEQTSFVRRSKLQDIRLIDTTPLLDKIEEDIEKIEKDQSMDGLKETLINISKMIHGVNQNILQVYTKLSSLISKVQIFISELQTTGRNLLWAFFILFVLYNIFEFFWTI